MRSKTNRLIGLLSMATLVMATLALPQLANAGKKGSELPFKGWAEDLVLNPPDLTDPTDTVGVKVYEIVGVGNATHLGKFTRTKTMSFDWGTLEFWGEIIFVAANGDELYVDFEGGPFDLATGTTVGEYTITGGTGRFDGASGEAYLMAVSDLLQIGNVFEGSMTLSRP